MKAKVSHAGPLVRVRRRSVRRTLIFAGLLAGLLSSWSCSTAKAADDFQTWQWLTIRVWKTNDFRLLLYGDNRMADNSGRQKLFILGPRVRYRLNPNLTAGAGYLFLDVQNLATGTWRHEHRLDAALTPHVELSRHVSLQFRNRLETRWRERSDSVDFRSRHRLQLRRSVNLGPIEALYCNNEIFIDYDQGRFNENRFIPAGVESRIHKRSTVSLFYMLQSARRTTGQWDANHILGTHLKLQF